MATTVVAATAGAPTPADAVKRFLAAEAAGRSEEAFDLLDNTTRKAFGSADAWAAGRSARAVITGFEVTGANGARVDTTLTLQPRLDQVAGYQPAAAAATFTAVDESGWHVAYDRTLVDPTLPDDHAAAQAALAWARAKQQCRSADEYDGSLLFSPALADGLCHAGGQLMVSSPAPLSSLPDSTPMVSAFGPDATTWARVVQVEGPVKLSVVLGPLGNTWQVVGVTAPA